jgi:iron(III) transport system ATP-binding protein
VADFVGKADFVPGVVEARGVTAVIGTFPIISSRWEPGRPVELMIRPDDVDFAADPDGAASISGVRFLGASVLYELTVADGLKIHSLKNSHCAMPPGTRVRLNIDAAHVIVFPRDSARAAARRQPGDRGNFAESPDWR